MSQSSSEGHEAATVGSARHEVASREGVQMSLPHKNEVPPLALVWTPIPLISWCCPFIGHLGITDSHGQLHDWHGTAIRAVEPEQMLFGKPARYIPLMPSPSKSRRLDEAIFQADNEYSEKLHCMGFGHDCHSHVARALNIASYWDCRCHNKVALAFAVFFAGRYLSVQDAMRVWLPPLFLVTFILALHYM